MGFEKERISCRSSTLHAQDFIHKQILPQGCRFVPYTSSETKPQMVPMDLNVGFHGFGFDSGPNLQPCTKRKNECNLVHSNGSWSSVSLGHLNFSAVDHLKMFAPLKTHAHT